MAKQLTLDLGHRPALGRDDFLVTPSNSNAVAIVDQWPHWPAHAAVIVGPAGSGKTHLAKAWEVLSNASNAPESDIQIESIPALLTKGAVILENLDSGGVSETVLFHLLNYARQTNGTVLFTAKNWPLQNIELPDLKSRLSALPSAHILPPDDALLRGVLVKQFNDRQIVVDEALVSYLVNRMPRSLDFARQLVVHIDEQAMEHGVAVNRVFAGRVLSQLESPEIL